MVTRLFLVLLLAMASAARAEQPMARLMLLYDRGNPVVAEMIALTVRGEYDLTVSLEQMQFPDSRDYDWIQTARDDWRKERVNGKLLQIFERRIAVFPRRDGPVRIGPVTHRLTYVTADGQRATRDVTAPPVKIGVKPFPGGYRPLAASQLTLTDDLSAQPGQLRKDQVLTRRVTIEALGAMAHDLPLRPDLSEPWLISFTRPEIRETVLTEKGPVARVVWEWELRPTTGEPAILRAAAFPWFDTDSRRIEVAAMKPIPFGFAGFGANSGSADKAAARQDAAAVMLVGAGTASALALLLRGQGIAGSGRLRRRIRQSLPSPHGRAMRRAARSGDLPALRAAAQRHLRWNGRPAPVILARLDDQLYAAAPPAGFDARAWLAAFRKALKSRIRR